MPAQPFIKTRWGVWTLFAAFWTLLGLSFASQFYVSASNAGRPVSWGYALQHSMADWYCFAILSVPVIRLARRFRLERQSWEHSIPIHLATSIVFSIGYIVLRAWVAQAQGRIADQPVSFGEAFRPLLVKTFHFSFLVYWVIVSVNHAFDFYREAQERQLREAELERRLAESRLHALQMQLNPHFLFNTLNGIASLMHKDVDAADRMITRLGELLRYTLESTEAHEVPLKQELAFLERYLEIEQTRFGDRLAVRQMIDPVTLDAKVPNLVLQPLIENAIRHGIQPHARQGIIEIRARRAGDALELEVSDNGDGLDHDAPEEGVGLSNTRARLMELYGDRQHIEYRNGSSGGLTVAVTLPFHVNEDPDLKNSEHE